MIRLFFPLPWIRRLYTSALNLKSQQNRSNSMSIASIAEREGDLPERSDEGALGPNPAQYDLIDVEVLAGGDDYSGEFFRLRCENTRDASEVFGEFTKCFMSQMAQSDFSGTVTFHASVGPPARRQL